ncbi:MAG: cytochrome C [Deltaproteobacteria bacterium]|nr:cytochrome C [Deltaproteobacteria bacterium]
MKKVLVGIVALLMVVVGGAAAFLATKPSLRPASAETVERTPTRIARGEYLVNNVLLCMDCHSDRSMDRYTFPPSGKSLGGGGSLCWDENMKGMEGFTLCAPNITPDAETGIGAWTDGEIMRAVREGVNKDGNALFGLMPYTYYASLSEEDIRSVVSYLRTLAPMNNKVQERVLPTPLNLIVKLMPKPLAGDVAHPDENDSVALGKYLATVGNCLNCHTPVDEKHRLIPERAFAGGNEFSHKVFGTIFSANITPHETGMGNRTRAQFIALFKAFASPEAHTMKIEPTANTLMPWLSFAKMSDKDLGAIYDYLKTVPPIENVVQKRPTPTVPVAPTATVPDAGTDAQ